MQRIFYVYTLYVSGSFLNRIPQQFLIIIKTTCVITSKSLSADVLKMTKKVAEDMSQLKNAYFNELE